MSLLIEDILAILRDGNYLTDSTTLQAVAKDLIQAEKEVAATKETAGPAAKTRLTVLIRGDAALRAAVAGGAWIVSVPDDTESTQSYTANYLIDRLRKAVAEHNDAPKARRGRAKRVIKTWFEAFTTLKAKTIKASGSAIGLKGKGSLAEVVVLEDETVLATAKS